MRTRLDKNNEQSPTRNNLKVNQTSPHQILENQYSMTHDRSPLAINTSINSIQPLANRSTLTINNPYQGGLPARIGNARPRMRLVS